MYHFKFLRLALSALMTVMPVNFAIDTVEFPQTRRVVVRYSTSFTVNDLGYADDLVDETGIGGSTVKETDAKHYYLISYVHDIQCSEACYLQGVREPEPFTSNHYIHNTSQRFTATAEQLYGYLTFTQNGNVSTSFEFSSADDIHNITLDIPRANNTTFTVGVHFKGATEGNLLTNIDYNLADFKHEYELVNEEQLIYQLVLNKDVNSVFKHQVLTLLENGDVDTAYNLVQNYYIDNSVTETEYNETVINQYQSKETDLKTVTDTEHNFSVGIEDNFNDQIQAIDTENSVISNSNFQQSALWVTDKFNRFTVNNAFGSILGFSLLLGLAMAIIGRVLK